MHCGVWVISFEPKTYIVAGSMRQQQIITVPAKQFQRAEIKFALQAHIISHYQIKVANGGRQFTAQPLFRCPNIVHCVRLHRANLVTPDKWVQNFQFFFDRIGRAERKAGLFPDSKHAYQSLQAFVSFFWIKAVPVWDGY